jgi:hypothetical protein
MEASEKPQLPLDRGEAEGAVRAIDNRLVIERLEVHDPGAARVVREQAKNDRSPAETVTRAIEIGARLIESEGTAANVDYVKREFERLAAQQREQMEEKNREHIAELSEHLAELFGEGRETAVQAKIKRALEERDQAFLDRLSADDELNPIRPLLATVRSWARERREDQDARDQKLEQKLDEVLKEAAELAGLQRGSEDLEAAIERGTQKGFVFEDAVHEEIERIASLRGDAAHHVGAVSNEAGSKKGDTLVEVGGADGPARARVIFEAKDKKLSRNDAWQELDAELEGRDACFAVLVVSSEAKLPARTQELHEYQGNKMVVVLDKEDLDTRGLELVYRYACARALMVKQDQLDIDAAGVSALAERAAAALKRGKGVRDNLTKAEQGIDGAREGFNAIVDDVEQCLTEIESLIEVADVET